MNPDRFPNMLRVVVLAGVTTVMLSAFPPTASSNPTSDRLLLPFPGPGTPLTVDAPGKSSNILVELFLSQNQRENIKTIKKELKEYDITRVRTQYYRMGNSPKNIAIGKGIPAPIGRMALRLAQTYNGGIEYLMPQVHFFPEYITIGSSAFDEASNIPISPEELERLSDPSLSTEQFHALYRSLTGEAPIAP